MKEREIRTVDVVWKEGWRRVGQIMREGESWCWWVNRFPDPELVAVGELVAWGWTGSEEDALAEVQRVMGSVDP